MSELERAIEQFDGKHTAPLEHVAASLAADPMAWDRLIDLTMASPHDRIAVAATWVLLSLVKSGRHPKIEGTIVSKLATLLGVVSPWEARLHLLQALGQSGVTDGLTQPQRRSLATTAMKLVEDPKPFVRAWSLNLLGLLGRGLSSTLQNRIAIAITMAESSEPASIKARIRQLRKTGALEWMEHI